ncbi:OpgC domain-containing protein [Burkholderia gladioli]|uniref:OpgC domain-containing protein n=1 Tax=Burkholderia gladioli TaxID=28095 RepID=UPI002B2495BF|nr:OpgC domain-containing protein [Burkholderia gladioli]MEB2548921.1 OpgC domain-containing protein [Burkholderia gladioli]
MALSDACPPVLPARSGRLIEIDFFRGIVLLMIVVDHIGGSMISKITLHSYALCDAAEVFVFLGGFAAASAFVAMSERHGTDVARRRFLRRAVQIYRAFLATTTLMLVVSAVLDHFGIESPNLALDDVSVMLATPLTGLIEVLTFQRQPYLASVLPMYVLFALATPAIVPLARRWPAWLFAGSLASWLASRWLGAELLDTPSFKWSFNPFAWQLMFVLGALVRCQPVYRSLAARPGGAVLTGIALGVVAVCAYYKLFSGLPLPEGLLKRDLAWSRVVSFLAIAWLMADLMRLGWVGKLARVVQPVVAVGQRGLVCYVVGTAISLTLDSLLHRAALSPHFSPIGIGFAADAIALGCLLTLASSGGWWQRLRRVPA